MASTHILPFSCILTNFQTWILINSTYTLERIYDSQFMYIIWFLVVYLTYFKKPVKETTFSSKIYEAFFANIRNDCVFSVIEK